MLGNSKADIITITAMDKQLLLMAFPQAHNLERGQTGAAFKQNRQVSQKFQNSTAGLLLFNFNWPISWWIVGFTPIKKASKFDTVWERFRRGGHHDDDTGAGADDDDDDDMMTGNVE